MRATGTLAVFCVLFGTAAFSADTAQATERNPRTAQKQARPGQVAVTPPRPPATQAATRTAAAKPAQPASRQAAATPPRGTQMAALPPPPPPAPAPRVRVLNEMPASRAPATAQPAPVRLASVGVIRPAIASPAIGLGGTPILPVSISGGLSCVPFARMATGMNISGDARMWWHNAAGTYARGNAPERGSVLAFTASGGMSRGHVAVVSRVVNSRTIHIDHANWGGPGIRRGAVMRGVVVIDASDRNDWTAVRVQVGHHDDAFGRTYSTHGFIYNRPAHGGGRMMEARAPAYQEVAEGAPSPHVAQHMRLTSQLFAE
ncbi:CHAP domain-containing protein [Falsiroseomonas stagni]|uniref:Surface antigen n=1 Tax=Falsiroseomonas stagni DSM 19981 TaxID=1123062 RepID=A0A1I4ATU4_9PROT|nr:CHAP domain-containing protein [Falsiroseomonas stagni]SFK59895.1 Surface antigen [Falsiroseomonas stagni DSM 19981]